MHSKIDCISFLYIMEKRIREKGDYIIKSNKKHLFIIMLIIQ